MTTRRTKQPLTLENREDLERFVYTHTPDYLFLEETRDEAATNFADEIQRLEDHMPRRSHACCHHCK